MKNLLKSIFFDTLKKDGKFSRTSLTMFTAWLLSIYMALYDLYKHGFKFEVFFTFVSVAVGVKIADSYGKKIQPKENETN